MKSIITGIGKGIVGAFGIAGLVILLGIIISWPIKMLYNATLPDMFGVKQISAWQGLYLYFLCTLLFKSVSFSKSKD
jgi:hypothetical protein